jgi:poly(A)-specific ribonuclease
MDVDDSQFWPQLLYVLKAISQATFVAIDVEMSGISTRGFPLNDRNAGPGKLTLQQFYDELRQAAEKYSILQLGITCIEEDREHSKFAT